MEIDPSDGLPLSDVGYWTIEKHRFLANYVGITGATRKKFAEATYTELFAGAGRGKIREIGTIIDGSPVVAWKTSLFKKSPFTCVHLGDIDPAAIAACKTRLQGAPMQIYIGPSHETVNRIVKSMSRYGYHFAFLDPFSVGALPFSIIEQLSKLEHMDMLVHVSVLDIERNLPIFLRSDAHCPFDTFAPNWRSVVNHRSTKGAMLRQVMDHWKNLVASQGMKVSGNAHAVKNSRNRALYWLMMISRHQLAGDFWDKVIGLKAQKEFW